MTVSRAVASVTRARSQLLVCNTVVDSVTQSSYILQWHVQDLGHAIDTVHPSGLGRAPTTDTGTFLDLTTCLRRYAHRPTFVNCELHRERDELPSWQTTMNEVSSVTLTSV